MISCLKETVAIFILLLTVRLSNSKVWDTNNNTETKGGVADALSEKGTSGTFKTDQDYDDAAERLRQEGKEVIDELLKAGGGVTEAEAENALKNLLKDETISSEPKKNAVADDAVEKPKAETKNAKPAASPAKPKTNVTITEMRERVKHLENICQQYNNFPEVPLLKPSPLAVHFLMKSKVILHTIPKVASTFWKRVLRSTEYCSPSGNCEAEIDLDARSMGWQFYLDRKVHPEWKNVILVREPTHRFLSGYVDRVVSMKVKDNAFRMAQDLGKDTSDPFAICGNNITFEDFLKHIKLRFDAGETMNPHWKDYYRTMNLCHTKWFMILKLETLLDDLKIFQIRTGLKLPNPDTFLKSGKIDRASVNNQLCYDNFVGDKQHDKTVCYGSELLIQQMLIHLYYNGYASNNRKKAGELISTIKSYPRGAKCLEKKTINFACANVLHDIITLKLRNDREQEAAKLGVSVYSLLQTYKKQAFLQFVRSVGKVTMASFYNSLWRDYELLAYPHPKQYFK